MICLVRISPVEDNDQDSFCGLFHISDGFINFLKQKRIDCSHLFEDNSFYAASFFNFSLMVMERSKVESFPGFDEDDCYEYLFCEDKEFEMPECGDMVISVSTIRIKPEGIMWSISEKYSGDEWETETIPWEDIY